MAAVPVGYEAFQSKRRKSVTLLCFLLTSTMIMAMTVYVDSYSMHEWNRLTDVGPIAFTVNGENLDNHIDEVRSISGVTKAELLESGYCTIEYDYGDGFVEEFGLWTAVPTETYFEAFPDLFVVDEGRLPENTSEIVIKSELNNWYNFSIGDVYELEVEYLSGDRNVTIVGFFSLGISAETRVSWRIRSIDCLSYPGLFEDYSSEYEIHGDIDRSVITPFDARSSLASLNSINEQIRELDPLYPEQRRWSHVDVYNSLEYAVMEYLNWQTMLRFNQIGRAGGVIVLVMLAMFLAIRHNINDRRYESNMLIARGASEGDVNKIVNRELAVLAIISCIFGILLGTALSRFAISATGFFEFDFSLILTEPFLVTIDSLIISVIVGVVMPLVTLAIYRTIYSTKRQVDEGEGRLAKVAKGLSIIRWDMVVLVLSALLLIGLTLAGTIIAQVPLLSLILSLTPFGLFLALASLSIKFLRRTANFISRGLSRVVGEIPASVGIRRIGKEASSAGPAVMVLVLAISLAWTNAIIDSSLPQTKQYHAQFSLTSDIAFQLDNDYPGEWDGFIENITNHELYEKHTVIHQTEFSLSAGYYGYVKFLSVNVSEYPEVAYDYTGEPLNESDTGDLVEELVTTPAGCIITEDVAENYELEQGDTLRAFRMEGSETITLLFTIIGIVNALPDVVLQGGYYPPYIDYPGYYYYYQEVGKRTILVNDAYIQDQVNITTSSQSFLCVKTKEGANATALAEDVMNDGNDAVNQDYWDTTTRQYNEFIADVEYQIDRAVDTVLTFVTVVIIFSAFAVYAAEGMIARKREIALLRSMGAKKNTIIAAQAAEMLVVTLVSLGFLAVFSPLLITNTLLTSSGSYNTSTYEPILLFPIQIFPVIPWFTVFSVLTFFILSVIVFVMVIAILSSRVSLSQALNAAWAEAGPYGGDR